ncbi:MAG TPA: NAD/NADP octopine/nopaline dehydrogenase family protein [Acidimicrobiia bacterium]|nr:NAD/NADP octopine/nopaline dehydrogenase family protein [Acidimicrobiia bacterium]
MKVAVLGGGHGAVAAAGDLALRGHEVRLALRNRGRFAEIFATRRIRLEGLIDGEAEVADVLDDHARAVDGAEVVVVPLPAHAQEEMAGRVASALRRGQIVYLTTGTFGSYVFRETLKRAGAADVAVAENATLPYGARISGSSSVRIGLVAEHLPTGVYPAARSDDTLEPIRELYPATEPVEDALSAGLLNFDGALHPPLVFMNAGAVEWDDDFDIHVDGNPPSVVTVSVALDRERIALREALGYTSHHWPLEDLYSRVGETFYGVISRDRMERQSVWRETIDFHHRYVTEDVGCGLALWWSLGRKLGVLTPLADVFLTLASTVNGVDYRRTGRTLENLGLADLSIEALKERLQQG